MSKPTIEEMFDTIIAQNKINEDVVKAHALLTKAHIPMVGDSITERIKVMRARFENQLAQAHDAVTLLRAEQEALCLRIENLTSKAADDE